MSVVLPLLLFLLLFLLLCCCYYWCWCCSMEMLVFYTVVGVVLCCRLFCGLPLCTHSMIENSWIGARYSVFACRLVRLLVNFVCVYFSYRKRITLFSINSFSQCFSYKICSVLIFRLI